MSLGLRYVTDLNVDAKARLRLILLVGGYWPFV